VQCGSQDCINNNLVPDPGGPIPVGNVVGFVEAMFVTGANGTLTEVWADDFFVEVQPTNPPSLTRQPNQGGDWHNANNWTPFGLTLAMT